MGRVVSGHVAYGIHHSRYPDPGGRDCGEKLYFDIRRAENLMNVDVIHGG